MFWLILTIWALLALYYNCEYHMGDDVCVYEENSEEEYRLGTIVDVQYGLFNKYKVSSFYGFSEITFWRWFWGDMRKL